MYNDVYDTMTQTQIWNAIETGAEASGKLREALKKLDSASNWGIADVFGGKLLVTAMKHNRLEEADVLLQQADELLQEFAEQLDGTYTFRVRAETSDALHFIDYIADNMVTDIVVQQRISRARSQVRETILDVERMLDDLQAEAARIG